MGKIWFEERIRTIILVDGLDHIERELQPEITFLRDLPLPNVVPEGVIFILGSQKIDLVGLSPRILAHLKEPGRTITMSQLDRRAVFSIIEASPLPVSLEYSQKEKILHLSEGHPLALSYLLQKVQSVTDAERLNTVLSETTPYKGDIEENYEVYWQSLDVDGDIRELLGYISRLRVPVELDEVLKWMGKSVVQRFLKTAHHFFRAETKTRWHFFHNSFRQFILAKTGRNIFDVPDEKQHRKYHTKLAEYAANADQNTPWAWEVLYHLASAGDNESVLKLGTQEYFREQFFKFRPLEDIIDDISLYLKAAKEEMDGVAIIRAFLIEKELRERNENLCEAADIPRLLLNGYGIDTAAEYVLRGRKLQVSATSALDFCGDIISIGEIDKARQIFDAAEPLALLSGSSGVGFDGTDMGKIIKWVKIAHYFRSFEKILQIIEQLRPDSRHPHPTRQEDEIKKEIQLNALFSLLDGVVDCGDIKKILNLRNVLTDRGSKEEAVIRLDFLICLHCNEKSEADNALQRIIKWAEKTPTSNYEKLLIAESFIRLKNDTDSAASWIIDIPQPKSNNELHDEKDLSQFSERIRLNRILSALGSPVNPPSAVPDTADERQCGVVFFERMLVIISNLWGCCWRKEKVAVPELLRQLAPAIQFFNRDADETFNWNWYQCERKAPEYFTFMINAVSEHGIEAVMELAHTFEKQWNNEQTRRFWPTSWRRHISLELYRAGGTKESLNKRLDSIEKDMKDWDELHECVQNYAEQAQAWLKAGKPERAKSLIPRMIETSFGIHHNKDKQFKMWTEWLKEVNKEGIKGLEERIRRFSAAFAFLINSNRGGYVGDAGKDLIDTCASWNPGYAPTLFSWLLDQGAIHFTIALEGMVTAALNFPPPPIEIIFTLVKHLIIPFQTEFSESLPLLLASKEHLRNTTEIKNLLELMFAAIETKAYPSERQKWLKALIEAGRQSGIDTSWIEMKLSEKAPMPKQHRNSTHPDIELKSGQSFTREEIIFKINSYEELLELVESTKEAKYFRWEIVLSKLIDTLDENQIKILIEKLKKLNPNPVVLSVFVKRLAVLGCLDDARILADQVMKESSPGGWDKWSDGGTRLGAVQSLIAIEPKTGRKKAYSLLVEDYLSEIRYPYVFLRNLNELLPILFESPPLDKIWLELEDHIYHLHDFSTIEEFPPAPIENSESISHSEMLIEVLISALSIPISEIRHEAHKGLCEIILGRWGDELVISKLNNLFQKEEDMQGRVLAILEAMVIPRKDFVEKFSKGISHLCVSPNSVIRKMARDLAACLHIKPESIENNRKKLPLTYRMELPEIPLRGHRIPFEAISPGEPFLDTSDPLEIIRPLQPYFENLSYISEIPFENLIERAIILMNTLSKPEKWNKLAEKKLRWWLKRADLELPFIRPRPFLALQAYAHILAELSDAGILDNDTLSPLLKELRFHNPTFSLKEPQKRPQEIVIPNGEEMASHPISEWMTINQEDFSVIVDKLNDGRVILGQLNRIVKIEWEKPTEYRLSMIYHPSWPSLPNIKGPSSFFISNENWYGFDYPFIDDAFKHPGPILCGKPYTLELGGDEWLAINPRIPLNFGWEFDNSGLFRWVDKKGKTMIESIMWQDGPTKRPQKHEEVCSNGWIVVATPDAVKTISKIITPVIRLDAIVRKYTLKDGFNQDSNFLINKRPHSAFTSHP